MSIFKLSIFNSSIFKSTIWPGVAFGTEEVVFEGLALESGEWDAILLEDGDRILQEESP